MWYKSLPSQSAQEVLKDLAEGWKPYRSAIKGGKVMNPHPPGFMQENRPVTYMQNGLVHGDGDSRIRLSVPEALKKHMREKYGICADYLWIENDLFAPMNGIRQITLYPPEKTKDGIECRVIVVCEIPDVEILPDNGHWLAIDQGLRNLITFVDSDGGSGILGRKQLSISRNCWRKVARVPSEWYAQQSAHGVQYPKTSKHIQAIWDKRHHCNKDYLHKITTWLADYCVDHSITRVIIGDLTGIRYQKDDGAFENQKLHSWPFKQVHDMLRYKLAMRGIKLIDQNEAWTSQCSPLARKVSKKYATPEKRVGRGMYKDGSIIWNADAVSAFNIMRKWAAKEHPGVVLNPKIIGTPTVIKVAV